MVYSGKRKGKNDYSDGHLGNNKIKVVIAGLLFETIISILVLPTYITLKNA